MKTLIKNILLKSGILYRLQYSHWYRQYKKPGYKNNVRKLFTFYNDLFKDKRPSLIFDIGANNGDYSYIFSKIADKLVCVEPDEKSFEILKARFERNKNIVIVKKAVAAAEGTSVFHVEAEGSTLNTLSDKWVNILNEANESRFEKMHEFRQTKEVMTTSLNTLIKQYGKPDYIKIDVEGFEKEVVSGLNVSIPVISFECNLPEFEEETIWIIDRLHLLNNKAAFSFLKGDGFELKNSVSATDMKEIVINSGYRFLEIYCFN